MKRGTQEKKKQGSYDTVSMKTCFSKCDVKLLKYRGGRDGGVAAIVACWVAVLRWETEGYGTVRRCVVWKQDLNFVENIQVCWSCLSCSPYKSPRAHLHVVGMLGLVSDISQPSMPTPFYSVLVYISVFIALSTVFHCINSLDNSPFSHSVLPVLSLPYWSFQLYVSLWKSSSALI